MSDNKIIEDFISILDELTFNSRPIITTLTKMAEENVAYAQPFVDAIESRIGKCVPNQKLYTFYTLDSICKNAGSPYTIYFSRNLAKLYRQTYLIVDNQTRTKLISMFKTWMTLNSNGESLFDKESLDKIEQFLIKASALHQKQIQSQLPPPTVPTLLKEIDKLTVLTKERLNKQPNDSKLQTKILVLQQLRQELQKEKMVSQALHQVQMQLRQIFAQEQQILMHQQQEQQELLQRQHMNNVKLSSLPPLQSQEDGSSLFGNATLSTSFLESISRGNNMSDYNDHKINKNKISKVQLLYKSLKEAELLFEPKKESIVFLVSKLEEYLKDHDQNKKLPPISLLQDILGNIKSHFAVLNIDLLTIQNLQLSQQCIMRETNVQLFPLLYRGKPNKCTTCGKRFGNSIKEQKLEIEHLDWHFRINKRIKGTQSSTGITTKNIQSRNWYLDDNQWVHFKDDEIISTVKDTTLINTPLNINSQQSSIEDNENDNKITEAELFKKYVTVPETSTDMSFQCPICTEITSGIYDEDLGEWVWKNCIHSQGKYFHATCFHETVKDNGSTMNIGTDLEKIKTLITRS